MGSTWLRVVVAGLLLLEPAWTPRWAAGQFGENNCCNGIDDDQDGWADFADSDCANHPECEPQRFHRGDARPNGRLDITDAIQILGFLFGSVAISCQETADVDDNGHVEVTDAILVLRYLFSDGPAPAPPGPPGQPCGLDPTGHPSPGCSYYAECREAP
jgi:hypothetical protein